MLSLKKKTAIGILSVLLAALMSAAVFFIPKNNSVKSADAAASADVSNHFCMLEDDLWLSGAKNGDGKKFNLASLEKLYYHLTGIQNATLKDVEALGTNVTSDYFRSLSVNDTTPMIGNTSQTVGRNISVMFNGYHWTPVNLNRDRSGNVILTLMLTDYQEVPQADRFSTFSDTYNNTNWVSGMYSSSKIRVVGLNIGGEYVTDIGRNIFTNQTQSASHPFARFTMPDVTDSCTEFLVAPAQVAYQETERNCDVGYPTITSGSPLNRTEICPNEAYSTNLNLINQNGKDGTLSIWTPKGYAAYTALTHNALNYYSWKDDLLWLPSQSEIGIMAYECGLWKLDRNARNGGYASGSAFWTRTGGTTNQNARVYNATRYYVEGVEANKSAAVRPALHLNLTKADGAACYEKPTDIETTYNGEARNLANLNKESALDWYNIDRYNKAGVNVTYYEKDKTDALDPTPTDAGDYTVKIDLTGSGEAWADATSPTDYIRTINLKIKPKPLNITWTTTAAQLQAGVAPTAEFNSTEIYPHDKQGGLDAGDPLIKLSIKYKGRGTTAYPESTTLPTQPGQYTATAYFESTDPGGKVNYEVTSSTATYNFEIVKRDVKIPVISGDAGAKTYNGTEQSWTLDPDSISSDVQIVTPTGMTYDEAAHTLKATDVPDVSHKYKVTLHLKDSAVMQWAGGTSSADKTIELEMKPIELTSVTFTLEAIDGQEQAWGSLENGKKYKFKINISGIVESDQIKLHVWTTKQDGTQSMAVGAPDGDGIYTFTAGGKGSYVLHAELDSDKTGNKNGNYTLAEKTQNFTVTATQAGFDGSDIVWMYSYNGENAKKFDDLGGVNLVYQGHAYRISIDDSGLAGLGVKIDTTYNPANEDWTNGYSGDVEATDAGAHTVKVRLTALSDAYEFKDETFDFTFTIDKAKFDLSGVKWAYRIGSGSVTEYTQAIEYTPDKIYPALLKLPEGIKSASFNPAEMSDVKSYEITVLSFTLEDGYDKNYLVPSQSSADSYTGAFEWTKTLEVKVKSLNFNWSGSGEQEDKNGKSFSYPKVQEEYDDLVEYHFYSEYDPLTGTGTEIQLEDIEVNEAESATYYIVVTLNADMAKGNYELGDHLYTTFLVGGGKTAVTITLAKNSYIYDKNAHGVFAELSIRVATGKSKPTEAQLTLTYYKSNALGEKLDPIGGAPKDAGEYLVVVALTAAADNDFALSGSGEIKFKIEKATFDESGLRWIYYHDGAPIAYYDFNNEQWRKLDDGNLYPRKSIIYDGTLRKIVLDGVDKIDGLDIKHAHGDEHPEEPNGTCQNIDAGEYEVQLTFVYDQNNYNAPKFDPTFKWWIAKAAIDTSDMEWDYAGSFTYTRENGAAKEFGVTLSGVPEVLADKITYANNKNSSVGNYTATFTISGVDDKNYKWNNDNYDSYLPSGLKQKSLDWKIEKREFAKPSFDESASVVRKELTFDDVERDFVADLVKNLGEGWENYFDASVQKDDKPFEGLKIRGAGKYILTLTIKSDIAGGDVTWADGSAAAKELRVDIAKLVVEITAEMWSKGSGVGKEVQFAESSYEKFGGYKYFDGEGEETDLGAIKPNVTYKKQIYVLEAYASDVEFEGALEIDVVNIEEDPNTEKLTKPTMQETQVVFDNEEHTFVISGFDGEFMELEGDSLTQLHAGTYSVTVRIKSDKNAVWNSSDEDNKTKNGISFEFTIEPMKLSRPEGGAQFVYDGTQKTFTPLGFDGAWMEIAGNSQRNAAQYHATISIKQEFFGDVVWSDGGEREGTADWTIAPLVVPVPTPTGLASLTYTGAEQTIELNLGEFSADILESLFEISGNKFTNAGSYTLTIKIKSATHGSNVQWETAAAVRLPVRGGAGKTAVSGDTVTIDYSVAKAKIPVSWDTTGTVPALSVPSQFMGLVEFEYTYTDPVTGAAVSRASLAAGNSYSVAAQIKETYANNFEFSDGSAATASFPFNFGTIVQPSVDSPAGDADGNLSDFFQKNWLWIVLVVAIILLIVAIIAILSALHRRRREREMDKKFEMMMRMQAGAFQPMGAYRYQDGAPVGGIESGQRLALPANISEETLAKAIAMAFNEVSGAQGQQQQPVHYEEPDDDDRLEDVDGFYDEYTGR